MKYTDEKTLLINLYLLLFNSQRFFEKYENEC